MSDKAVYTVTGTINYSRMMSAFIESGQAGRPAFFAGMKQGVENSVDAGASRINIVVNRRADALRIEDDGSGFGETELQGFFSLMESPKLFDPKKIGRNDTGRIFLLLFAKTLLVYTVSKKFPEMVHFELARESLDELAKKGKLEANIQRALKPSWWEICGTGSAICLTNVDWSRVPSPSVIRKEFPLYLKPSIARMVFVNGEPLEPRAVVGEVIQDEILVDYLPGMQEIELYIPESRKQHDEVRVGGFNPICSLKDMVRQGGATFGMLIPDSLRYGEVCGDIFLPMLNEFRGHDGHSIDSGFFSSEWVEPFIRFLREEVEPRIKKVMEDREEDARTKENIALLNDVCDAINTAYENAVPPRKLDEEEDDDDTDDDKGSKPEESPIRLNCGMLVTLPGEQHRIRITRSLGTSGQFNWLHRESGGRISQRKGKSVLYTAGTETGKFRLIVEDSTDSDKKARVSIRIVDEKPLVLSPVHVQITAGDRQRFRVRNLGDTSGRICWKLSNAAGLRLSSEEGSQVEVITSPDTPSGEYQITASDFKKPDLASTSSFEVLPREDHLMLCIEGKWYLLDIATTSIPNVVHRDRAAALNLVKADGSAIDVMQIDLMHPVLQGAKALSRSNEVVMQALLPHLITAHLQGLVEDGEEESMDENSMRQRLAEIHRQIMLARTGLSFGVDDE